MDRGEDCGRGKSGVVFVIEDVDASCTSVGDDGRG